MELLNRTFSAQSVALAAGATAKQISDWCSQGQIVGQREPLGRGQKRQFSFFNVMEVSIALSLMEIGVRSPADAFRVAQTYSHTGGGGEGPWVDSPRQSERLPGLPFHYRSGETLAFVAGRKCLIDTDSDVLRAMSFLGNFDGVIVLNVSRIFALTMRRLGLEHVDVLDQAYPAAG